MINKFKFKKTISLLCAFAAASTALFQGGDAYAMFSSSYMDTRDITVSIDATDVIGEISPYIYGINAESDISGVSVNALKQTDYRVSSYNWENNFSNSGTGNVSANNIDLVGTYPPGRWVEPALYTEYLLTKAKRYSVSSRYVTLQMMGMVAADGSGNIFAGDTERRWNNVLFSKNDSYLSQPDVSDGAVYMDEYVSYLVNRYGYAVDGGINGYFLDSEPENWNERFPNAAEEKITAEELSSRSADLASAIKRIDPTALVYGPSVCGIEAYTSLKNAEDWEQYSREYSWFIDYYLMRMNDASHFSGTRLLDVLDIHYHTEATNGILQPILDADDALSNNTRMQAPRIFWDSTYTENSTIAILHNQHIPLIPTLEASINMYYPGTKLSFSEYNFGGGDNISGGIATADTLGIFGKYGVHMACLKPNTEDISYHKAALNLYTNYDGHGTGFGTAAVKADNGGDVMSSVYAAVDGDDMYTVLRAVMLNKNQTASKRATVEIASDVMYETAEIYYFDETSAEITKLDEEIALEDNSIEFEMSPLSAYMLVFRSPVEEITDEPVEEPDNTNVSEEITEENSDVSDTSDGAVFTEENVPPEHVSAETFSSAGTTVAIDVGQLPENTDVPTEITVIGTDSDGSTVTDTVTVASESKTSAEHGENSDGRVPMPVKVIVSVLLGLVILAMLYVIFSTGKKSDK